VVQSKSIPQGFHARLDGRGDVSHSLTHTLPPLMDHRYPTLAPLAFEMFYDLSALRGLPVTNKPLTIRVTGGRVKKNSRDLMVRVEIRNGHMDGIVAMLASSSIKSRTLERHHRHLRMMHHVLAMMGHKVELVMPEVQAWMRRRAKEQHERALAVAVATRPSKRAC
jgi:hypothetical protein